MEVYLQLGGVLFAIQSERELDIDVELSAFIQEKTENYDLIVSITWDWDNAPKPEGEMIGQDLIQNYYIEGDRRFCETRGGWKGATMLFGENVEYVVLTCQYLSEHSQESQWVLSENNFQNSLLWKILTFRTKSAD